jgi:lipopolysaccharide/colanic/teichoic acid biosynthesis glycosyltransferase
MVRMLPAVVRGQMSLVGLPVDLPATGTATSAEFNGSTAYLGPCGVTGLVQISMHEELTADEIERYMLYYAKNQSMILDLEILIKSLQRDRRE